MEEAILFRSMIESLSTNEFNQFTNKIFSTFDQRELLTKSIFHLLAYQGRNALTTKYTNNINKILSNIIHSRKPEINQSQGEQEEEVEDIDILEHNNSTLQKSSINNLSYDIISNIGSYFGIYDLIPMQLCNRHLYLM